MSRHPLVALIRASHRYRLAIGGFALRMAGAYAAALAAVWGAWKYGSPQRAAWLVACISVASALGALWVGHRHDHGRARPLLRVSGATEAIAVAVLAVAGTRSVPEAVLLGAGALAGVTRAVWSAAVTPALADAAGEHRAVGAFGVGWAFDVGKLAGAALVAAVLLVPPAAVLVPITVLTGTAVFTRLPGRAARPVPLATGEPPPEVARADVRRAVAMIAIASFCLYQQDLLFRVAIDQPAVYAVAAAMFAVGAIVATAQLAGHAPGRLPARSGLVGSLVVCGAGTVGLLTTTGLVAATWGLALGWGCAYGIQGCRPIFAWAPRPGFASGISIALATVATATGAPTVVALLPEAGPAAALIGGSVLLAGLCAPDVHAALTTRRSSAGGATPPDPPAARPPASAERPRRGRRAAPTSAPRGSGTPG